MNWFHKTNSVLKCVCLQSVRFHFKFRATQNIQQTAVLDKFLKKNQNLLNKLLENKPKIISKGSPDRREIDSIGVDKRLITRRMTVLNKQLMQCISDVLSTEQIGLTLQQLEVRITQVKVNPKCETANIYWVSKCQNTQKVAEQLDQLKGKLRHCVMDLNIMHSLPWFQFVLDTSEDHSQEVERVLKRCDFGHDFEPSDSNLFETPYEIMSRSNGKPKNKTNDKIDCNPNVYKFLKIQKPNDMQMNCLGLDYESIINTVLLNLNKSRAQHRSFNAVADPLPPPDWSAHPPVSVDDKSQSIYNTEERIKVMKKFLVDSRKKNKRLSREKRKQMILHEMQVSYHLNDAFDYHQQLDQMFDDFDDQHFDQEFNDNSE